jgi:hypothetical protein
MVIVPRTIHDVVKAFGKVLKPLELTKCNVGTALLLMNKTAFLHLAIGPQKSQTVGIGSLGISIAVSAENCRRKIHVQNGYAVVRVYGLEGREN